MNRLAVSGKAATRAVAVCIVAAGALLAMLWPAAPALAADHVIEIVDFAFVPTDRIVRPGDTVTWINRDIVPHTATAQDGLWDTGEIAGGARTTLVVGDPAEGGTMGGAYYCHFHPSMTARLTVVPVEE